MKIRKLMTIMATAVITFAAAAGAHAEKYEALSGKQLSIIEISAFTANGNLEKLEPAFVDGLEAGLTVNEIKEMIVHIYAYAGFPRALNSQTLFMKLMDKRKGQGIKDEEGRSASPVPEDLNRDLYGAKVRAKLSGVDEIPPEAKWQRFNPVMDRFLKEHLFADIFVRDVLSHKTRELVTISALASISGTAGQLRYHLNAAMNVGNSEKELKDFVSVIKDKVGSKEGGIAEEVLSDVLESRK
ncbi:carboxymuconolactone decarboxylase family protein [Limisalsivibrio acetivorans]|uniref:carboxymuconolactone decarboxylase family protein n=1 Tax=Limisalsivibrio acetivorans TaxID=1304888 RepID=UPI0003B4AFA0|nr:carboxymuconolactone decarboxylase family protein [Limisalsivibrio acetivorans]